jgi:hypothetical protein
MKAVVRMLKREYYAPVYQVKINKIVLESFSQKSSAETFVKRMNEGKNSGK